MNHILLFNILFPLFFGTTNTQAPVTDSAKFMLTTKLALDLDGARHAYHPNNEGIDNNLNGGINETEATQNHFATTGNRGYGIAKKLSADKTFYIGYLQSDGYFVSQTTVYDKTKTEGDPARYADAETIPYIAFSPGWKHKGIKLGDVAYVINLSNGKAFAAIFADSRNNDDEIEISLALADSLGIPVTTKTGKSYDGTKTIKRYVGIKNAQLKIFYFTHSGNGHAKTPEEIQTAGKALMHQ
jgi:hypothetical protein